MPTFDVSQENCLQVQCGVFTGKEAFALTTPEGDSFVHGCSAAGYTMPLDGCNAPECAPYLPAIAAKGICSSGAAPPKTMTAQMPTMVGTANAVVPPAYGPPLTIDYLNQRMPSIVNPLPTPAPPACSTFAAWVDGNPLLAALGLAALGLALLGGGRK